MAFLPSKYQEPFVIQTLKSCKSMQDLKQIQSLILKSKPLQTHIIFSKMLSFCALSPHGDISYAQLLLARFESPTISMYNVLIRGFSLNKRSPKLSSLLTYQELLQSGLCPNTYTFPSLIKKLSDCEAFFEGRSIHAHVVKMGFEFDTYVRNNLVRFYSVCGEMGCAQMLFDRFPNRDLVTWATLISGYSKLGFSDEAVSVFIEMIDEEIVLDAVIMTTMISACAKIGNLELGKKLHSCIDAHKLNFDVFVWNALIDMYSKCKDLGSAYSVFKAMPEKTVVSWNSMILGFAQNGEFKKALSLFRRMQREGLAPDETTLVGMLKSCASLGALELGQWVHSYMKRIGIKINGIIGNALIDMYAKCGEIDQATKVFINISRRDMYTYTSMIAGFAMNGEAQKALDLFAEISSANIKPNAVTFIGVLSACSHANLVDVGLNHFNDMSRIYGITPEIEHYGCVIDLLARAGFLDEAYEFINRMPIEPDAFIWGALLGACKVYNNVDLGEHSSKKILELKSNDEGAYVIMSNIYAYDKQKENVRHMREGMKKNKVRKTPGCSLIEVDGVVHEFRMRDESHPRKQEIYMVVEEIGRHLRVKESLLER